MGEQYPPTTADYAHDAADSAMRLVRGTADRLSAAERQVAEDKLEAEALEVARIAAILSAGDRAHGLTMTNSEAVTRARDILSAARQLVREGQR